MTPHSWEIYRRTMPVFRKNGKNILFIHVPKCGGSSVENAFRTAGFRADYLDRKVGHDSLNHLRTCSPQHLHAAPLAQQLRIDRFELVFMVVREPLARLRSEYVYVQRAKKRVSRDASDVTAWVRKKLRAYEKNPFVLDNHLRPQSEFSMPEAVVYRLEDGLDAVFADLNDRFHVGVSPVERALHSEHEVGFSSSQVEIDDEVRSLVRDFYREDFVRFGYDPETFAPLPGAVPFADGAPLQRAKRRLDRRAHAIADRVKP